MLERGGIFAIACYGSFTTDVELGSAEQPTLECPSATTVQHFLIRHQHYSNRNHSFISLVEEGHNYHYHRIWLLFSTFFSSVSPPSQDTFPLSSFSPCAFTACSTKTCADPCRQDDFSYLCPSRTTHSRATLPCSTLYISACIISLLLGLIRRVLCICFTGRAQGRCTT